MGQQSESLDRLRQLVHSCLSHQQLISAVFYADKLACLSRVPGDVLLLAQAYMLDKQPRRALNLLRNSGLIERDWQARYLAGKCLAEVKDWEECLAVLGDGAEDAASQSMATPLDPAMRHDLGAAVSLQASVYLLRGQAYHALDNRVRAVMCYKQALMTDAYCHEAFTALIEGHLLTCEEEAQLLTQLRVHPSDHWLPLLLKARCKKYGWRPEDMESLLSQLEAPATGSSAPAPGGIPLAATGAGKGGAQAAGANGGTGAPAWMPGGLHGHLGAATPAGPLAPVAFPGFGTPATGATAGAATPASMQQGAGAARPFLAPSTAAARPGANATAVDASRQQQEGGLPGQGGQGGAAQRAGAGDTPTSAMSYAGTPMSITLTPAVTAGGGHTGQFNLQFGNQQQQQQLQGQQMFLQQQQQGPSTGGFGTESTPLQALQQYQQGQQQYFGGSDMGDHDMGIASPQPSASVTGSGSPATPVLFLRGSAAADQQQRQKQQRGGDRHAGTKFGGSTLPQQEQQQAGIVGAGATQQGGGAGQAQADQQQSQQAGQQGDGMGTIGDRGPPGCGLAGNVDVLTCKADWLYHRGQYAAAHGLTSELLESDPYAMQALPLHLSCCVVLGKRSELFQLGHRLTEAHPSVAVAWFAVGCYYMVTRQYDQARRYFGKATALDPGFAPAWVAFGHAFSAQDERDQAMAAYRTAARLFPSLHAPVLGMGMEYSAMNNLQLAERMLEAAHQLCPTDPQACHEMGVLAYKAGQYASAVTWLRRALHLAPKVQGVVLSPPHINGEELEPHHPKLLGRGLTTTWEPTALALGHSLRKQGALEEALQWYDIALCLSPGPPGTLSARGLTLQLLGDMDGAIQAYHSALAARPEDAFASEMLHEALAAHAQMGLNI